MPGAMHVHDHAHGDLDGVSPLGFTGERVIPGDPKWAWCFQAHLFGYHDLARRIEPGGRMLEIGCGEGYGASVLAKTAARVVTGDVAADVVRHARDRYPDANVSWVVFDAQALPFADDTFDTTCSLQVIEHFRDTSAHLEDVVRVTKPGGLHYVTTPNIAEMGEAERDNPFHLRDFDAADLRATLEQHFDAVSLEGMFYVEDSPRYRRMREAEGREELLRPKLRAVEERLAKLPGWLRVRLRLMARRLSGVPEWPLPEAERARNAIVAADFYAGEPPENSFCLIGVARVAPRRRPSRAQPSPRKRAAAKKAPGKKQSPAKKGRTSGARPHRRG